MVYNKHKPKYNGQTEPELDSNDVLQNSVLQNTVLENSVLPNTILENTVLPNYTLPNRVLPSKKNNIFSFYLINLLKNFSLTMFGRPHCILSRFAPDTLTTIMNNHSIPLRDFAQTSSTSTRNFMEVFQISIEKQ